MSINANKNREIGTILVSWISMGDGFSFISPINQKIGDDTTTTGRVR